ncbi:Cyclin-U1-1 like [Actinidia chinensis var. chinensis]|uniref:Cyclin n=1 Tax=Actinidia chinensis var. chinensis TaxID=1590841 RepID=A0A2R6PQF2_ACTCC|nr:Cyclin-U1-1 like [Actinidia chinensis var. chinensis]
MLAVAAADDTHLRGLEPSPAETATPGVLTIIAFVLDRLVARNDQLAEQTDGGVGWDLAPVGTSLSTFHGVRAPSISIGKYLERIYKYTHCSPSCFVVGYVYIDRLVHRHPNSLVVSLNVHRLLVTSVMVASKMLDDVHFNNAFYARVGGVSNSELNRLELELLFLLDFGVTVSSRVFESYCVHLEKEMLWNGTSQKVERVLKPNSVEDVTEMPLEEAQSSSPSNGTTS